MNGFLKQSTAATLKIGPFLDDTDGKTAETGLTISQADVRLSKNGGDMAQKNNSTSCTHDELGYYDCPVDATDTDTLGRLKLMVAKSGALPVWHEYTVLAANVYDALIAASDKLQVDAVEISSDSAAADSLELIVENAKGTDNKILISTDAQDLSTKLDVRTKVISTDAITADAIKTDAVTEIAAGVTGATLSELAQAQPPSTPTVAQALMLPYMAIRNEETVTATVRNIKNDAGTVITKAALSDDGTTFTKGKLASGA